MRVWVFILAVIPASELQQLIGLRFLSLVTLSKFGFYQFLALDLEMNFMVKHVFTRYADCLNESELFSKSHQKSTFPS